MSVLLVAIVSLLVSLTTALLCDLNDLNDLLEAHVGEGKYFYEQRDNSCYVFALNKVSVVNAQYVCRSFGGHLTDVESQTNNMLQNLIANETIKDIATEYWIGLLWNTDFERFYWDNGAMQQFDFNNIEDTCTVRTCACVAMTSSNMAWYRCTTKKSFICKLDLGCQSQEDSNDSVCPSRCVVYIRDHIKKPMITFLTPPPWDESTAGPGVTTNTTDGGNGTSYGNQNRVVAESQPNQAEDKLMLIILMGVGALTGMLLVAVLVMCALIVKYRRLLNDKDKSNRISMVDILHADSPSSARRKRPSDHSGSHPGSTSELLYSNPYNTYSTPEADGAQAAEAADVSYQENGYSVTSGRPAAGNEVRFDPQVERVDNEYMHLNRAGDPMDQHDSQHVYGIESAAESQTDARKISNTYENYTDQH